VLADDLVRCHQLKGQTYKQIVRLLGRPHFTERRHGEPRVLEYEIGLERDYIIQIDSEFLNVELGSDGVFRKATFGTH
jgi:hypothetical protein